MVLNWLNTGTKHKGRVGIREVNQILELNPIDPSSPAHPPLPPHWAVRGIWQELCSGKMAPLHFPHPFPQSDWENSRKEGCGGREGEQGNGDQASKKQQVRQAVSLLGDKHVRHLLKLKEVWSTKLNLYWPLRLVHASPDNMWRFLLISRSMQTYKYSKIKPIATTRTYFLLFLVSNPYKSFLI